MNSSDLRVGETYFMNASEYPRFLWFQLPSPGGMGDPYRFRNMDEGIEVGILLHIRHRNGFTCGLFLVDGQMGWVLGPEDETFLRSVPK